MICLQHLQQLQMTTPFNLYYYNTVILLQILKKSSFLIFAVDLYCYLWCFNQGNMLLAASKNSVYGCKFSSTSFKGLTKIPRSLRWLLHLAVCQKYLKFVIINIFILTSTLFVLHAISTPSDHFKSCSSQRNFFHGNSGTYLQFCSTGMCFFHLLFFVLLPKFFYPSEGLQFFQKFSPFRFWSCGLG